MARHVLKASGEKQHFTKSRMLRRLSHQPATDSFYLENRCYKIEELLEQWQKPAATYFRVRADDKNTYTLCLTRKDNVRTLRPGLWPQALVFEGIVKRKHAIGKRIEDELKLGKPKYGSMADPELG
ncbi:hypothetical protein MYX84_16305 [Acidobacteria bacterium AH-259-O06]|nr:hypothetical protein [Acidobacteria bacterium AH-259-O06]